MLLTIEPPLRVNSQSQPSDLTELYAAHVGEWAERFAAAMEATRFDCVVIYAGEEQTVFRDDTTYPFVAEPYFRAWAPLTRHPGSAVRFDPGKRPRLVVFQDSSFWHEPARPPTGAWLAEFELVSVATPTARAAALGPLPARTAAIGPPQADRLGHAVCNDRELLARLDYTRARKTAYEVACIEQANARAALGHRAAQEAYADDESEFAIDAAYRRATRQSPWDLPYQSIVALNEHAAVLHYQNLRHDAPGSPSSFLLDAGASCNGYASDITRTLARGSQAMQGLISAVDAMQRTLVAETTSGVDFVALNERAHALAADVLHERGLLRVSAAEAHTRGITRSFLPHGLGHLLGLQVHDAGGRLTGPEGGERAPPPEHPMLRLTRVLEPGFVVTIEPGIYFIPSLLERLRAGPKRDAVDWAAVDELSRFGGVRIEDDVLVTEGGGRSLTRSAMETTGAW